MMVLIKYAILFCIQNNENIFFNPKSHSDIVSLFSDNRSVEVCGKNMGIRE